MCDVVTIGGAALAAGGALAQSQGANAVAKARSRAIEGARVQRNTLNQQAEVIGEQSRARHDNFNNQQGARGQQLGDYFAAGNGGGASPTSMPASESNIVTAENAKQGAKTAAYSGQQAAALGNMRSFGDVMGDLTRAQARDAGQIGQINNFKAGNASLLPYGLDTASHAGDSWNAFGSLAQGVGRLGMSAGLSGVGRGSVKGADQLSILSLFGG